MNSAILIVKEGNVQKETYSFVYYNNIMATLQKPPSTEPVSPRLLPAFLITRFICLKTLIYP